MPDLDTLVRRNWRGLAMLVRRYECDTEAQDDALGDALVAIAHQGADFDAERGTFLTWAGTIVRKACAERRKRLCTQSRGGSMLATVLIEDLPPSARRRLACHGPSPERTALDRYQVELLSANLSGRRLEIVRMLAAGESIQEIAEALGVSRSIVDHMRRDLRQVSAFRALAS